MLALASALTVAGCGGGGGTVKKTDTAGVKVAETHWRAGLIRWRHDLRQALDGISVIFSTESSLVALSGSPTPTSRTLARYESTLVGCGTALARLGPVPERFRTSDRYARRACKSLADGERLVEAAVVKLHRGTSVDPFDPLGTASDVLGLGQSEVTTAVISLDAGAT